MRLMESSVIWRRRSFGISDARCDGSRITSKTRYGKQLSAENGGRTIDLAEVGKGEL